MAYAAVRFLRAQRGGGNTNCTVLYECHFWGSDAPSEIDSQVFTVSVVLLEDYSLADLKDAIVTAVQTQATELSLTVASGDINIPSWETG